MSSNTVNASIITIGDELLIGQTIDTNSAFIGQELNKIGVWVKRRVAVGDVYDDIWNATQKELLLRGKMHGYYRMYWGKKIIEWSPSYGEAIWTMLYIHDRWALDGRDPNTYANILWLFGLFDRPWPERPVLGKIRYMSLEGMRRKTRVDAYIEEME